MATAARNLLIGGTISFASGHQYGGSGEDSPNSDKGTALPDRHVRVRWHIGIQSPAEDVDLLLEGLFDFLRCLTYNLRNIV